MPPRPLRRMVGNRAFLAAFRTRHSVPLTIFQTDLHPLTRHVQFHTVHFPRTLHSQEQPVMPMQFVMQFFHPPIFHSISPLSAFILPEESYFGFRHVNGPKEWDSLSKAAYVAKVRREYGK